MRLEARQIDDGRGPYRWRPIVRTADGLALGGIYTFAADDLTEAESAQARGLLAGKFEVREADA